MREAVGRSGAAASASTRRPACTGDDGGSGEDTLNDGNGGRDRVNGGAGRDGGGTGTCSGLEIVTSC